MFDVMKRLKWYRHQIEIGLIAEGYPMVVDEIKRKEILSNVLSFFCDIVFCFRK